MLPDDHTGLTKRHYIVLVSLWSLPLHHTCSRRGFGLQVGLTWSDAPLAAVYSRPYVIALMPGHIEIRSAQHISQQGLAQVRIVSMESAPHSDACIRSALQQSCKACVLLGQVLLGIVCLPPVPAICGLRAAGKHVHDSPILW